LEIKLLLQTYQQWQYEIVPTFALVGGVA